VFAVVILLLVSHSGTDATSSWDVNTGFLTALSFVVGALTSILAGYIGMIMAVFSNARATVSAKGGEDGWREAFDTAFRAGGVMGYSLCALSHHSLPPVPDVPARAPD
jgi:H+-translocating diphosphatase